jgi:hypothetical protein
VLVLNDPAAWDALEAAVVRVGPGMNAQEVATTAWGYATLGWELEPEARGVLRTSTR